MWLLVLVVLHECQLVLKHESVCYRHQHYVCILLKLVVLGGVAVGHASLLCEALLDMTCKLLFPPGSVVPKHACRAAWWDVVCMPICVCMACMCSQTTNERVVALARGFHKGHSFTTSHSRCLFCPFRSFLGCFLAVPSGERPPSPG